MTGNGTPLSKKEYLKTQVLNQLLNNNIVKSNFAENKISNPNTLTKTFDEEVKGLCCSILRNDHIALPYLEQNAESLGNLLQRLPVIGLSIVKDNGIDFSYLTQTINGFNIQSTYNGLIKLAVLNDVIKFTTSHVVCENDEYFNTTVQEDGSLKVEHSIGKNALKARGNVIASFCCSMYTDGFCSTSLVTLDELIQIRTMANNNPYWHYFFPAMARKTAVRQEAKNWIRFGNPAATLSQLLAHEEQLMEDEFPSSPVNEVKRLNEAQEAEPQTSKRKSFLKLLSNT